MNVYTYDTGATDYVASIRLQVLSTSFNPLDPALVFSAFGSTSLYGTDRVNSFAIDNGAVRWSDDAGAATVDTTLYHDYAFRYVGGTLSFYIDQAFASVADGTATAVLTRSSFTPNGDVGRVAFGDFTNDRGYNSQFIVDFVTFENLTPASVPEPASLTMLGLAFAGVAARRRVSMAGRRK